MDANLQAAYRQGYASAATRRAGERVISATASAAGAAAKSTTTMTAAHKAAASGNMSFSALLRGIFLIFWAAFTTVWSFFWPFTQVVLFLLALVVAFGFMINIPRISRWFAHKGDQARDWYDDFAVNNNILLNLEHGWSSFNRAMFNLWLTLRWNWYTDQIMLARQEIRLFYDKVMANMFWILAGMVLIIALCNKLLTETSRTEFTPWNRLPPYLAAKAPAWVLVPRKWEGSNSHYRPAPKQPEPVPWEDWAKTIGSDQSVSLESASPEVVMVTQTEHTIPEISTATQTERTYTTLHGAASRTNELYRCHRSGDRKHHAHQQHAGEGNRLLGAAKRQDGLVQRGVGLV